MAQFRIGQKVKIRDDPLIFGEFRAYIGRECVITGPASWHDWTLSICHMGLPLQACETALVPLTDPKAEEFVRRVTKPQPVLVQGDIEERV